MKAEAPEKLYFGESDRGLLDIYSTKESSDDIEYTRTDALMKKAVEFMKNANLYLYHCISEECDYVDTDKFIDDFKKYVKGE